MRVGVDPDAVGDDGGEGGAHADLGVGVNPQQTAREINRALETADIVAIEIMLLVERRVTVLKKIKPASGPVAGAVKSIDELLSK